MGDNPDREAQDTTKTQHRTKTSNTHQ